MRILRIILLAVLFWAVFENRSDTSPEFVRADRPEAVEEAGPNTAPPAFEIACAREYNSSLELPRPIRITGSDTIVRPVPTGKPGDTFFRRAGIRATGSWCAPVKSRYVLSYFADPVSRVYVLRLRRLLI